MSAEPSVAPGGATPVRLCLFGASADTGNLGVSALMTATVTELAARLDPSHLTVFDNGLGARDATLAVRGRTLRYELRGARIGRRVWRGESLWTMRAAGLLGGLGNAGVAALRAADAVLDVSGGDSFTDLYSRRRFQLVALPKLLALQQRVPLVLLPQTYGPFRTARARRVAERIVRGARQAWSRDPDSHAALRELLGDAYDPVRHRAGVDVAFLLAARRPREDVAVEVEQWIDRGDGPLVGLNVSGLVYADPGAAARFSLTVDYARAVAELLRRLLDAGARVLLVGHVRGAGAESDDRACAQLLAPLGPEARSRVRTAPEGLDATETKWLIGRTEWFCGTRMHATIAALSQGVPSAAIAYSGKTRGVFATCGQAEHVADARALGTDDLVARVWRSFEERDRAAACLDRTAVEVAERAARQMDDIAAACAAAAADGGRRRTTAGGW